MKILGKIKIQTWILWMIVFLQLTVMFFWLGKKEGMHVDEMYSLESVHCLRTGVIRLTDLEGWYGNWHTVDDFNQHFVVGDNESFLNAPFLEKLNLVKRESIYEILLNILLSITMGKYSLKTIVLINMGAFVLIQTLLYKMGRHIFENKWSAILPPLFFGFSAGAVNMVLYIRMYTMVMLISLILLWLHILLLQEKSVSIKTVLIYIGILTASYFGYVCHQYMALWIGALCGIYCIMQIVSKKWKWGVFHIGIFGVSGSFYLFKNKWLLEDFLYGGEESRAREAVEILMKRSLGEWKLYLQNYWTIYMRNALGGIFILLLIVIAILMAISYRKGKKEELWIPWEQQERQILAFTVYSSIIFYIALSRIAPDFMTRYISYIYPAGALIVAICTEHVFREAPKKYFWGVATIIMIMMVVINGKYNYVENIYEELIPIKAILEEEKYQVDNIYVNSTYEEYRKRHQIYRDGYLWQEGLRYYVTTPEMLEEHNAPGIEECNGDAVLLWVADGQDTYEILKDLYSLAGFSTHEKLGYTQESKVYYLTREEENE